jgi:uncharacterized membrane protein YkoI
MKKMNRSLVVFFLLIIPLYGLSKATEELVKSMVPGGKVSIQTGSDFSVRTEAGTKVIVEFSRKGDLDEASGLNLGSGDIFEPGNGLISLGTAAQVVEKQGHKVKGEWRLERDSELGWIYELEGTHDRESMEFVVDAKSAQLIKAEE